MWVFYKKLLSTVSLIYTISHSLVWIKPIVAKGSFAEPNTDQSTAQKRKTVADQSVSNKKQCVDSLDGGHTANVQTLHGGDHARRATEPTTQDIQPIPQV